MFYVCPTNIMPIFKLRRPTHIAMLLSHSCLREFDSPGLSFSQLSITASFSAIFEKSAVLEILKIWNVKTALYLHVPTGAHDNLCHAMNLHFDLAIIFKAGL